MKYNELNIEANKSKNRVGRGISAGQGKTAGRGTKGYHSRTGSKARPGFEGGQNPLMQRLPKLRGFRSHKIAAENVYTGALEQFSGKTVTSEELASAGLISSAYVNVKLLKGGELTKKVTVKLPAASASAVEAVEAAGGSFEKTARLGRPVIAAKKTQKAAKADKAAKEA
jgi:large subunit ribosomal protein L15